MNIGEHRDNPTPWNHVHDEIEHEVKDWTVKDLFGYKAERLHSGHLSDIIEAVVQDLYKTRVQEEIDWLLEDSHFEVSCKDNWNAPCEDLVAWGKTEIAQRAPCHVEIFDEVLAPQLREIWKEFQEFKKEDGIWETCFPT